MYPGATTRLTHRLAAAAATMDADKDVLVLSGTTALVTMTPKSMNMTGQAQILFIIPTNAAGLATTAAGNFVAAVTMLQNTVTAWIWIPSLSKWYPHALA